MGLCGWDKIGGWLLVYGVMQVMKRGSKEEDEEEEADDKEQLSPVGVMDFPFDEDDDDAAAVDEDERVAAGACSFSFSDSLAQLQSKQTDWTEHVHSSFFWRICHKPKFILKPKDNYVL